MDIKEMNRNTPLFAWREKDYRNRDIEFVLYLQNPKARTNGCGLRTVEPIPFLRALGVKLLENHRGYAYYAVGCYTVNRDPTNRWYVPVEIPDNLKQFYDTLPNKVFKAVLKPHSQNAVIEWMKEGITGAVETEAYE